MSLNIAMELAAILKGCGFADKYPDCTKSILENVFAGVRTCRNCGSAFEPPRKERMTRYCSEECRKASSSLRHRDHARRNRTALAVTNGVGK